jgi:hypothetical protein
VREIKKNNRWRENEREKKNNNTRLDQFPVRKKGKKKQIEK